MLRKTLLISVLLLSGCAIFKTKDPIIVRLEKEPLNIEVPVRPKMINSKSINWKLENEVVSTSKNEFVFFLEELLEQSKYTSNIEEILKTYKDYVDTKPVEVSK